MAARKITREVPVDNSHFVGWLRKPDGYETFYIKFRCAPDCPWTYQHMSWSCRGARHLFYRAMVQLYKLVRRAKLTALDLHYLAGTTVVERYYRHYPMAERQA